MKRAKKADFSLIFILFSLVLGLLIGWLVNDLAGHLSIATALLLNSLGLWVFISSLIADFSPDSGRAAIHNFVFLMGVIIAYYAHLYLLGVPFAFKQIITWVVFAAFGALFGFIAHNSRAKEWIGAICASVPVSLLIAEAYGAYTSAGFLSTILIADAIFAIILYFLLAPGKYQKLMALPFIIIFVFALVYFNVLSGLLGAWI